jgi:hypothetical protein
MKKIIYLILMGLVFSSPAMATVYPVIGGLDINHDNVTTSELFEYIFYLLVIIGSFVSVIFLAIAGLEWSSSGGDPSVINSAKKKIKSVFAGLFLLLSVHLIFIQINPDILKIKTDDLSKQVINEIEVPLGDGVYLHDRIGCPEDSGFLRVVSSLPNFSEYGYRKTKSIGIRQPQKFNMAAILFAETVKDGKTYPGTEYAGDCAYILNSINDLNSSNGNENNPPIGDKLDSMIVLKGSLGGSVTLYNNFNCEIRSDKYCKEGEFDDFHCLRENEKTCEIASLNGFQNLKDLCPDFKGDIVSIETNGNVGVLLKNSLANEKGTCQFFEPKNSNCINMIKYGSMYYLKDDKKQSVFSPKSIVLFSLAEVRPIDE